MFLRILTSAPFFNSFINFLPCFLLGFLSLLPPFAFAQTSNSKADSLSRLLPTANDSVKVKLLSQLTLIYQASDLKKSLQYAQQSLRIAQKTHHTTLIALAYSDIATTHFLLANYDKVTENTLKALPLYEKLGDSLKIAKSMNMVAGTYIRIKEYEKCLPYLEKALLFLGIKDDKSYKSVVYLNMGEVYYELGNDKLCLEYEQKAYQMAQKHKAWRSEAFSMGIMGKMFERQKQYEKALKYQVKSLAIFEENHYLVGIAEYQYNVANLYNGMQNNRLALEFALKSLQTASKMGAKDWHMKSSQLLATIYQQKGSYQAALQHYQVYDSLKEVLFNDEKAANIMRFQANYENEAQETKIALLEKDNRLHEIELQEAEERRNFLLAIALLILASFAVLIYFYVQRQQDNKLLRKYNVETDQQKHELAAQNEMVGQQKELLERAFADITDSVKYARRIQFALLPTQIQVYFPNSFIFYKPKDIVSGDFYWFTAFNQEQLNLERAFQPKMTDHLHGSLELGTPDRKPFLNESEFKPRYSLDEIPSDGQWTVIDDKCLLLACGDCTGHGVPGAFMTLIGNSLLNQIVNENHIYSPAHILTELDKRLLQLLQQADTDEKVHDGMDISLIRVIQSKKEVIFAAAQRPLLHFTKQIHTENFEIITPNIGNSESNQEYILTEYKGSKNPIGSSQFTDKHFTEQLINYQSGDTFYLFTDGYADQFGGEKGQKFMNKNLKILLESMQHENISVQKELLQEKFEEWKGYNKQLDDVLMIGLKLS